MPGTSSTAQHAQVRKIPELDGIRGVAILFVIIFHFGPYLPKHFNVANRFYLFFVGMGWIGVDLFFVLSGFLITRILLNTKHSAHYFKSFYIRRALRILPIYYLGVFIFFDCLMPLTHISSLHLTNVLAPESPGGLEQLWYWFHISNWQSAFGVYAFTPIGHIWSLAIEEQFYLVWPLVVLLCGESSLMAVCIGLIVVLSGLRYLPVFQTIQVIHTEFIYRLTPFRIEPLLFGAILALAEARQLFRETAKQWGEFLFMFGCIGMVGAVLMAYGPQYNSKPMSTFGLTAVAVTCFSVVLFGIRNSGSALARSRILRSPILTQCGKYSYSMYIFQTPLQYLLPQKTILYFVPFLDGFAASILAILLGISLSYLAARCSWALIEQRFLRLKDRFPAN
jgi:peptidoglycan/LPS O-acetylase OafA/YrhL